MINQKYLVNVFTINSDDRVKVETVKCKNMQEVSRHIVAFKPKKGYEIIEVKIKAIGELF